MGSWLIAEDLNIKDKKRKEEIKYLNIIKKRIKEMRENQKIKSLFKK